MKVFKFGGASLNSIERFKNTAGIIAAHKDEKLLVIVSAMGKTTNALEKVAELFFEGNTDEALLQFQQIKDAHLNTLKYTSTVHWQAAETQLKDFFTEVEWLLHDKPVLSYDYYYDQIVCCGELMSTALMYHHLVEEGIDATWIDVRDVVRTDNNFRDAIIDWDKTTQQVKDIVVPLFKKYSVVVTQGFVGATDDNESTTLGREGSDFSAAIFANILEAENVSIWKDVRGVMSGDPRSYIDAEVMSHLSYNEVVEMAYYGAQVIHPKTIKPLQNKKIPLLVKSFIDPSLEGTTIDATQVKNLPPVVVLKKNQVLVHFKSKDFSFVEDQPVKALHDIYKMLKIKPNLTQNTAISLMCCFDDKEGKIDELAETASTIFDVSLERNLSLLTVRHYAGNIVDRLTETSTILLQQKTAQTVQCILRPDKGL